MGCLKLQYSVEIYSYMTQMVIHNDIKLMKSAKCQFTSNDLHTILKFLSHHMLCRLSFQFTHYMMKWKWLSHRSLAALLRYY